MSIKKKIFALSTAVLMVSPLSVFAEEEPTDFEEILDEQIAEISGQYEVGEILSEEDADLIKSFAVFSGQNTSPTQTESFGAMRTMATSLESSKASGSVSTAALSPSGTLAFNKSVLNVRVTGTCNYNFRGLTYKYSCGTAGISDKVGVYHELTHDAFALLRSGEVMKKHSQVYKKSSKTRTNVTITASEEYFAGTNIWMTFKALTTSKGHTTSQLKQ